MRSRRDLDSAYNSTMAQAGFKTEVQAEVRTQLQAEPQVKAPVQPCRGRQRGSWGVLAVLLALTGCVSSPRPPQTADLPTAAGLDHLDQRALLLLLADRQLHEPFTVNQALTAGPAVREQLALTLARTGQPEGGPALERLLTDPAVNVRRAAVFALGELGEESYPQAAQGLWGMLRDPDRATGRLAVEALGKIGVPLQQVVASLIDVPTEEFFPRLLPALFRFSSHKENALSVVRWAEQGLTTSDSELHAMAAYALARTPRPEGVALLRQLLADPDPWVAGWAARGLGQVGDASDLERILPLLNASAPGPIIQALRAGQRLARAAQAPLSWLMRLRELVTDPRPGVRLTALEASATWLPDPELSSAVVRATASELPRERALAVLALAEADDPQAPSLVRALAQAEDPVLRARAAEAAGLCRLPDLVLQLAHDSHPSVRGAAFATLFAGDEATALVHARTALGDADPGVLAAVFDWAGEHPRLSMEELLAVLPRVQADRQVTEARISLVRALVARAQAEPLERGAIVAQLEELSQVEDFLLRRQAIAGLVALEREAPPVGGLRSAKTAELYRDLVLQTEKPRRVDLVTERGTLHLELACPQAPLTCLSFLQLAAQGFFDGLTFHRVVPDFVIQGGDPRGDGLGGPGYELRDEINLLRYDRGALGMALSGPDTGGSQFFITLSPQPHLDGGYTIFGHVVSGKEGSGDEVLERIVQGDRILRIVAAVTP